MPTLHLLPGESRGDNAEIVLNPQALEMLAEMVDVARKEGYACKRFRQRDGVQYTLCIEVIDKEDQHQQWRHTRLSYMRHNSRHVLTDFRERSYDADLLSAHLYAVRKARKHTQTQAGRAMGLGTAFVHNVEHCKHVPKPENFEKLLGYIGTTLDEYEL